MKPVAVVILNWNGEKLLAEFLPQVLAVTNSAIAEVIVVDNGSSDGSLEVMNREFPDVRVIAFGENYGFAEGYNRAIDMLENPYAVLLNSDVAPAEGWVEPLYDFLESHNDVAAVQPKIRSYRNRELFEHAGASGGFIDIHGYPYCRGRLFSVVERDYGQYDDPVEIFWASGAALAVRTDVYKAVGGLDANFFAHMEEIDMCWRMQLKGYKLYVVPSSTVFHLGGASLDYSNPRKTYLNFRNNLLMMHKNLPDSTRCRKLFVRRLLDTLAWFKYVASFDWKNASAILKAHRDFAGMRGSYKSHPDVDLLDTMPVRCNILTEHYLRRKTSFDSLKFMQ